MAGMPSHQIELQDQHIAGDQLIHFCLQFGNEAIVNAGVGFLCLQAQNMRIRDRREVFRLETGSKPIA
jgi:hypothetical protein